MFIIFSGLLLVCQLPLSGPSSRIQMSHYHVSNLIFISLPVQVPMLSTCYTNVKKKNKQTRQTRKSPCLLLLSSSIGEFSFFNMIQIQNPESVEANPACGWHASYWDISLAASISTFSYLFHESCFLFNSWYKKHEKKSLCRAPGLNSDCCSVKCPVKMSSKMRDQHSNDPISFSQNETLC